jgi:glycerol-3-phosphate acyltransferase PlsY
MYATFTITVMAAYLLGSIPFGVVIARAHGKDLRSIGSGNIGATNVARALGKKWAYICFGLDMLKGMLPMLLAKLVLSKSEGFEISTAVGLWLWLGVGCAAIVGHIFPVYLRFKGGKGVATSLGVALGLWPYFTICAAAALAVWVPTVLVWRHVSLASIAASIAFPIVLILAVSLLPAWNFADLWPLLIAAIAIPLMVIIRHRENIKRLLAGTENRIRKDKPKADCPTPKSPDPFVSNDIGIHSNR